LETFPEALERVFRQTIESTVYSLKAGGNNDEVTPWLSMISPVVVAIPKGSAYAAEMCDIIGDMLKDGMAGRDWHEAMIAMIQGLQRCGIQFKTFANYFDCGSVAGSPYTHPVATPYDIIHWSNATHNTSKETPTRGSEYHRLCKSVGLI
jgi:hypothetical protein